METQPMNAAVRLLETGEAARVALECGSRRITYGDLQQAVAQAAGAWQALGLVADDRVVVFAPDSIEWVTSYLGAIWAGGVAIGVNPRLGIAELASIVDESQVRFLWTTPELVSEVAAMAIKGLKSMDRFTGGTV